MLKSLSISNFAIIDNLKTDFDSGLSIITGETGAGKSIFIGALSLVLGNRADINLIKDKTRKCIVEAEFDIENYQLSDFFVENEIDYEKISIIRREILPGGKSRAFVNDTPVNVNIIKELGNSLVDIHSQHQSLLIGSNQFQLSVVDAIADITSELEIFKSKFVSFSHEKSTLSSLIKEASNSKKDYDYLKFQFDKILEANLNDIDELELLEEELKELSHAEEIKTGLLSSSAELNKEDFSALNQVRKSLAEMARIKPYLTKADDYYNRLKSIEIELNDIASEAETLGFNIEYDPKRINTITIRIDLINSLIQKNQVGNIKGLIDIKDDLEARLDAIESYDERISGQTKLVSEIELEVNKLSKDISKKRQKVFPQIEENIRMLLAKLGMPGSKFIIRNEIYEETTDTGIDKVSFMFSASDKIEIQEIQRVASGGELSRLMLCIKSLIAKSANLPTMVLDEIDSGVSGEIADKVGNIIYSMSKEMQVINITHLPQVAAKGDKHFRIYKTETDKGINTFIELLNKEDRVIEIAKMLSGSGISDAAIQNARNLLKESN